MKQDIHEEKKQPAHILMEHEILDFWDQEDAFAESVRMRPNDNQYVFYDGPPFATGLPHYGHIVASVIKDAIPRYQTMNGYRVERVWGWDCHGLPIENIVEKELGFKQKKEIVEYGVEKFNDACRATVLEYVDEWKAVIRRMGRWVDMENAYKTMDLSYMESVWWVFAQLYKKQLVYEGKRSIHICPRCETTLSQQEVSEGYKEVKDLSVIAKFAVKDQENTFLLAWTTTPWTLIGNVALAVGAEIIYATVEHDGARYILAQSRVADLFAEREHTIVETHTGADLVGMGYAPLFDYYANDDSLENRENGWQVYAGDFVTDDDGTGIVHIAPAFGEDDMRLGKENNLPFIQHVGMNGVIEDRAGQFAGLHVKHIDDHTKTDVEIIRYLAQQGTLFHKAKYAHSYPHCWRCDTPLLNYVTTSWYVNVTAIKDRALTLAEDIHWAPEHIKEGRFGKWLAGARDWSISRQRFWGSVIPLWRCTCGQERVFDSVEALSEASGETITDIHSHIVDSITVPCSSCDSSLRRIPDVLDTWFDSGAMPYAQMHYPFENKERFEQNFPAKFIGEGIDQTRAWFYYLHVLATAITDSSAFENVIVNGVVLAEDGKKMSKRLKNYPDPMEIVNRYGADSLRLYLAQSPVVLADTLNFSQKDVEEIYKKYTNTLLNVVALYELCAQKNEEHKSVDISTVEHVLDRWILSKLYTLRDVVTEGYDGYDLRQATKPLIAFVQELSTWYVRRSRDRFKGDDTETATTQSLATLRHVLSLFARIAAPITPFIAEHIYRIVRSASDPISVHHTDWPEQNSAPIDVAVMDEMSRVREAIEHALAARAAAGIKVRQPLASVTFMGTSFDSVYEDIVRDELNVKAVLYADAFAIDTTMTEELRMEGLFRELVRKTNAQRKKHGLTMHDRVIVTVHTESTAMRTLLDVYSDAYCDAVIAKELRIDSTLQKDVIDIDGEQVSISFDNQ